MVKESVLIDNTITETRQFIKSLIPQIKGKIVKEDSRRIVWTYRFGLDTYRWGYDTIECQTQIVTSVNGTIITTTSQNYDLSDTNLKEPITKFYDALKQKFNVKETNEIVEKPKRNKTKPKSKHSSNSHKSILWKLIAIVGFIAFIFYMGSDQQTSGETTKKSKSTTASSSTYVINEGSYYGATSKETLKNFIRYSINEEYGLVNQLIQNGKVFEIQAGKEVILIKSNFGTVKIRFKGESFEFWTVIEAISK